jgi:O-antigen ligase
VCPQTRLFRLLIEVPRWLLVVALVFAPWAYGSTRAWAVRDLSALLSCICALWIVGCFVCRRLPRLPTLAVFSAGGLLLQGWWMAVNAHSFFDAGTDALLPETPWVQGAPGSADGPASMAAMCLVSGLLGAFLFCCDLAQHPVWRKRIWITIAMTGASIAAFGVIQKIGGNPVLGLIWEPAKQDLTNNFAAFRYRGNAGAYLNIVFPLAAGLCFVASQCRGGHGRKALAASGLFIIVMGIQLNPSRASWVIAIVMGLLLGVKTCLAWRTRRHEFTVGSRWGVLATIVLGLLAISAISLLGNWETSWRRMDILGFNPVDRSPTEIYLQMVPQAGLTGFGPGTFSTIFPPFQESYDFGNRRVPQFWKEGYFGHAHEDYLETLIEWGYFGTFLWSILLLGGIVRAISRYLQKGTSRSLRWLLFCSLLAIGGTLLQALADFPLQIASIRFYALVLLGICWGSASADESETRPSASFVEIKGRRTS